MSRPLRVPEEGLAAGATQLSNESSRYVVKVHRKKAGATLVLFDPIQGVEADAAIEDDRLPHVRISMGELRQAAVSNMPVTLAQAVGKSDKPEQAVRDATALGAERVVLLHTERSVARGAGEQRQDRLMRVAAQVARQCERGDVPEVLPPHALVDWIASAPPGRRLVCAWHESVRPLHDIAHEIDWQQEHVTLLIGAEGGLSESEVAQAIASGFEPVSLGPYVLRAEVACSMGLSVLRAAHARQ